MPVVACHHPRLLIVAYNFPRTQTAGGHRYQAMAKYLSKRGWEVAVLTVLKDYSVKESTEHSEFMRYIPKDIRVFRTQSFDFDRFYGALKNPLRRKKGPESAGAMESSEDGGGGAERRRSRFLRAPMRRIVGVLNFPDKRVGWFFPLLFWGWKLLRKERFDVVLTSSPPHSTHLPVLLLKHMLAFKWVVDFRDPWTAPRFCQGNRVSFVVHKWLEKSVLSVSNCVLANTAGNKAALHSAFRELRNGKVVVLTNGLDEEVTGDRGALDESSLHCDFLFTGFVYPRMLNVYMDAISFMRANGQTRIPRLHIFGQSAENVATSIRQLGLDDVIVLKGNVSYEQSLWLMKNAKALLLPFIGHDDLYRCSIPSKLYAYLFSSTPFIALAPEGDAAHIIERVGGGVIVNDTEPELVSRALMSFLNLVEKGAPDLVTRREALREYSWERLSSRLDRILRDTIWEPSGSNKEPDPS